MGILVAFKLKNLDMSRDAIFHDAGALSPAAILLSLISGSTFSIKMVESRWKNLIITHLLREITFTTKLL